jgi:hypothetical protein
MPKLVTNKDNRSCVGCGKVHRFLTKGCVPIEFPEDEIKYFASFGEPYEIDGMCASVTVAWREYVLKCDPKASDQFSPASVDDALVRAC